MDPSDAYRTALKALVRDRFASRLFDRDGTLWAAPSPGGDPPGQTLGWLDLPGDLPPLAQTLLTFATEVRDQGFTDAVVCGMGGSSMTPEVLRATYDAQRRWLRLHVLDTVHPDSVGRLTEWLDLSKTLFLIASKSGTTIEPLTLETYFRKALKPTRNVEEHFVALTDAGSRMAKRALAGEFRKWFETPADVGGRFSALSAFGMLPAALMGLDLGLFATSAASEVSACRPDAEDNLGLQLGAFLGGNAAAGRNKVCLLTSPRLDRFSLWVEQLLAESTGKGGAGLVPVAGEPIMDAKFYGHDRQFVYVRMDGDENAGMDAHARALSDAGHPVHRHDLSSLDDLGAQFFRWELAVSAAARVIGVYPFDQPDVELAKQKARDILAAGGPKLSNGASDVDTAITSLLDTAEQGAYLALAAFADESEELTKAFNKLRVAVAKRTGMATTFGYGPRYQHSIGQLYKGGPASVTMLILKSHGTVDFEVPGASYTLSALTAAMADGDTVAMREKGRRTEAVVMGDNPVAEISAAAEHLVQKH